jgi:hypothetical protein
MRMNMSHLLGIAVVTLPLLSTAASAAYPTAATSDQSTQLAQAATNCPPGTYWENGGYVADGKWRDGHCARDNGRQ